MTLSTRAHRRLNALQRLADGTPDFSVWLPLRMKSRGNARGSWRAHADTHARHRLAVRLALSSRRGALRDALGGSSPLVVRMVRVEPRLLDDDNLAAAFKSLRDGVADVLGVDDRDPRVVFVPDDELVSKTHGARLEFYLS